MTIIIAQCGCRFNVYLDYEGYLQPFTEIERICTNHATETQEEFKQAMQQELKQIDAYKHLFDYKKSLHQKQLNDIKKKKTSNKSNSS